MEKNFLTIDWDYFIDIHKAKGNSYRETEEDIIDKWYREYLISREENNDLEGNFELGKVYQQFIEEVLPNLQYKRSDVLCLSESHAAAYHEAVKAEVDVVYLFDAHSDLGYGGIGALNYEVNCANWLGKLLKDKKVKKAYIIYSPYTREYPAEFEEITALYDVTFITLEAFCKQKVYFEHIHICRSGPWTPPWYDHALYTFASRFGLKLLDQVGGLRDWHPEHLTLAETINYKLGVI